MCSLAFNLPTSHSNTYFVPDQAGHSGKTVPELEKTVGLMKKVVERVQRENESLKKSSGPVNQDKVAALEQENEKLKVVSTVSFYTSHTFCRTGLWHAPFGYCRWR